MEMFTCWHKGVEYWAFLALGKASLEKCIWGWVLKDKSTFQEGRQKVALQWWIFKFSSENSTPKAWDQVIRWHPQGTDWNKEFWGPSVKVWSLNVSTTYGSDILLLMMVEGTIHFFGDYLSMFLASTHYMASAWLVTTNKSPVFSKCLLEAQHHL